jgi:hypothetical protein
MALKFNVVTRLATLFNRSKTNTGTSVMTVTPDGAKEWRNKDGELHREDGPAYEARDGSQGWYINGKLHRVGGPALTRANGDKEWYLNGLLHREDGPALDFVNGGYAWYKNGRLSREDGPALHRPDGWEEWYRDGHQMSVSDIAAIQERMKSVKENSRARALT